MHKPSFSLLSIMFHPLNFMFFFILSLYYLYYCIFIYLLFFLLSLLLLLSIVVVWNFLFIKKRNQFSSIRVMTFTLLVFIIIFGRRKLFIEYPEIFKTKYKQHKTLFIIVKIGTFFINYH